MEIYFNSNNDVCVVVTNPDGTTWSGLKSVYDEQRADTITQSELDAEAVLVAQAQADAQAKAEAEATAQANFTAQLAATNAKLEALGLTAQDIATLLNAAKG